MLLASHVGHLSFCAAFWGTGVGCSEIRKGQCRMQPVPLPAARCPLPQLSRPLTYQGPDVKFIAQKPDMGGWMDSNTVDALPLLTLLCALVGLSSAHSAGVGRSLCWCPRRVRPRHEPTVHTTHTHPCSFNCITRQSRARPLIVKTYSICSSPSRGKARPGGTYKLHGARDSPMVQAPSPAPGEALPTCCWSV